MWVKKQAYRTSIINFYKQVVFNTEVREKRLNFSVRFSNYEIQEVLLVIYYKVCNMFLNLFVKMKLQLTCK